MTSRRHRGHRRFSFRKEDHKENQARANVKKSNMEASQSSGALNGHEYKEGSRNMSMKGNTVLMKHKQSSHATNYHLVFRMMAHKLSEILRYVEEQKNRTISGLLQKRR